MGLGGGLIRGPGGAQTAGPVGFLGLEAEALERHRVEFGSGSRWRSVEAQFAGGGERRRGGLQF